MSIENTTETTATTTETTTTAAATKYKPSWKVIAGVLAGTALVAGGGFFAYKAIKSRKAADRGHAPAPEQIAQ